MFRTFTRRVAILAMGFAGAATLAVAQPASLTVFAAASLKNALDEVDTAYAARSHVAVKASYAASSALARQIEQAAPADVFVSADSDWMDYVGQRRLIVAASRRDVLTNHLALIAPAASTVKLSVRKGFGLAATLGDGRLAIAGPEVPAGKYGRASLAALGVWDSVKDRLAPAENVRGALAFVAQGEAPLGIVYDTDAKTEPKVRIVGLFPDDTHPRIVYPAAVVAASRNPAAAGYLAFLKGPQASAIFQRYGFTVLAK
ncbi:MAG TPA: molybdate ABC transporter substrate-binding protein [Caulobacteraceae bacterium]|jgi:molybdate transport system substrate-binding protein|nr:molybdate ABC transporter substrate-binding protein [Caulobacteraceae bacterium]